MNPKTNHKLPAELSNELLQIIPEFFCRRVLVTSNFLFYNLIRSSKRGNEWKRKTIVEREQGATYSYGIQTLRPLLPRNGDHQLFRFLLQGTNLADFSSEVDDGRVFLVSLRSDGQSQRQEVRDYFGANAANFSSRFSCAIDFFARDELQWDLVQMKVYWASLEPQGWREIMMQLKYILMSVEQGSVPSPIPPPTPAQASPESSISPNLPTLEDEQE